MVVTKAHTLDSLKAITTLRQLSPLLGLKPAVLAMQLYKKDKKTTWYTTFDIPKRNGGVRTIHAPEQHLKRLQKRLSVILDVCRQEIAALHGHPEDEDHQGIAHGFKQYHSIISNGRMHVGRRYVFNVDLQDFFGTIHFGRVRAFFSKNKNFKLHPKISEILAHIACFQGKLPQGSPCSPVISNLIAHSMDVRLAQVAERHGASYTRYADDLTFSTNLKDFPPEIAAQVNEHEWVPGKEFAKIVEMNGFSFNPRKTRMQYRDSRQEVTGLTVNHKVNVTATYRYKTRSMVDHVFKTGEFSFSYKSIDHLGVALHNEIKGSLKQLLGRLNHIDQVDLSNERLRLKHGLQPHKTDGRLRLFRRFLYFYHFYALAQPVIVGEGKTDNVYLHCAIKSRATLFPALSDTGAPPKLKVRLFKYSERRTSKITDIGGGVGGICKLIKHYFENFTAWRRAPTPAHPVIIVIDNDSGAKSVYATISGITKVKKPTGLEPFIHVIGNLYVVPTPPIGSKASTDIEDFFDAATLSVPLNGKKFNKKDNDSDTEYGKAIFATTVVAKNSATIDFSGFDPLLLRIVDAIIHYYGSLKVSGTSSPVAAV